MMNKLSLFVLLASLPCAVIAQEVVGVYDDGGVKVVLHKEVCSNKVVSQVILAQGADPASFSSAKVYLVSRSKPLDACVMYGTNGNVLIVDEEGDMGVLPGALIKKSLGV